MTSRAEHGAAPGPGPGPAPIDRLGPGDAAACAHLEAQLFDGDDPWSAAAFASELRAGHHYLAARRRGVLVGYAGIALMPAPSFSRGGAEAEVHTIGVDPAEQGRGTGRALLRGLLVAADALGAETFLEVRTDNPPALALYRSEGFEVVGVRRRYYALRRRRPHHAATGARPALTDLALSALECQPVRPWSSGTRGDGATRSRRTRRTPSSAHQRPWRSTRGEREHQAARGQARGAGQ